MNETKNYRIAAVIALVLSLLLAFSLTVRDYIDVRGGSLPEDTSAAGASSAGTPEATTSSPEVTTSSPEATETGPEQSDTPSDTSGPCESTSENTDVTDPADTEAVDSSEITEESSGNTQETVSAPDETTAAPPETTAAATTAPETKPPTRKMKVGISPTTAAPGTNVYADAAKYAGFETVILPTVKTEAEAAKVLAGIDAIMLTGGEDIDPKWYGEEALRDKYGKNVNSINAPRDTSDMLYIKGALELDMPMLAVCRGMQLLNVACGGTLYQDLPMQIGTAVTHRDPAQSRFVTHLIDIEKGSLLNSLVDFTVARVNSWHHQAIKDVGEGLVVTARAQGDGIVECVEMPGRLFVLGTQFHPEQLVRQSGFGVYRNVFAALYEKACVYAQNK